jgi:hypothetical protein
MIEMVLPTDEIDKKRVIHFKLEVPKIYAKRAKGPDKYMESAGWRFFYDYLKSRMVSVQLGITDLVEEFSANIVMQLPDGREGTLAELIKTSSADPAAPLLPFIMEAQR